MVIIINSRRHHNDVPNHIKAPAKEIEATGIVSTPSTIIPQPRHHTQPRRHNDDVSLFPVIGFEVVWKYEKARHSVKLSLFGRSVPFSKKLWTGVPGTTFLLPKKPEILFKTDKLKARKKFLKILQFWACPAGVM